MVRLKRSSGPENSPQKSNPKEFLSTKKVHQNILHHKSIQSLISNPQMLFTPLLSLSPGCQVYIPGLHFILHTHSQGIPLYHNMQLHVKIILQKSEPLLTRFKCLSSINTPGDNFLRNIGVVNGPSKTMGLTKF